ncbi:hypothetical protein ABTY00_36255 [Streptomyces microflavus]|uniref:hypothetical protein n=1 Tax=Streptomyces microflavus TaxID=1919 RepID=UPI003321D19C
MSLLDHDKIPESTVPTFEPVGMPALTLTRRGWDFLFDQLRSTTAVLDYLFRAAGEPPIALGDEPVRYYEFAAADAFAPPEDVDTPRSTPRQESELTRHGTRATVTDDGTLGGSRPSAPKLRAAPPRPSPGEQPP